MSPITKPGLPPNASRAIATPARLTSLASVAVPVAVEHEARAAEGVGQDAVGAGLDVAALDGEHALRMGEIPLLAAVALLQAGEHQLRAHRAVADERPRRGAPPVSVKYFFSSFERIHFVERRCVQAGAIDFGLRLEFRGDFVDGFVYFLKLERAWLWGP